MCPKRIFSCSQLRYLPLHLETGHHVGVDDCFFAFVGRLLINIKTLTLTFADYLDNGWTLRKMCLIGSFYIMSLYYTVLFLYKTLFTFFSFVSLCYAAMIYFSLEHECLRPEVFVSVWCYHVSRNPMWDGPFQRYDTKIKNSFSRSFNHSYNASRQL